MRGVFFRGLELFLLIAILGITGSLSISEDAQVARDGVAFTEGKNILAEDILGGMDPILYWHTFMGSSNNDVGEDIALDDDGNIYVAGQCGESFGNPVNPWTGDWDVLISELNSSGVRQWHTFLGSDDEDQGEAIAIDAHKNVHVAGWSEKDWGSPIIPYVGSREVFVTKHVVELPDLDIKANGSDSTITINEGDPLSVTIELDGRGLIDEDADWWILMRTDNSPPNKWLYFDLPTKSWLLGKSVTLQRALFDTGSRQVPKTLGLAPGTYAFYFAVDMVMNGAINVGSAYYDKVKVIITP